MGQIYWCVKLGATFDSFSFNWDRYNAEDDSTLVHVAIRCLNPACTCLVPWSMCTLHVILCTTCEFLKPYFYSKNVSWFWIHLNRQALMIVKLCPIKSKANPPPKIAKLFQFKTPVISTVSMAVARCFDSLNFNTMHDEQILKHLLGKLT